MSTDTTTSAQNISTTEDHIDISLREALRQGRITRTKDDQGRDVFHAVAAD